MQVDVTTRLGALTPATPTGLASLDRMMGGGLRSGALVSISGMPGSGKTAMALTLAYMAARSRAAVIYASATLDETEVMARLSARALHREYPDIKVTYGSIWSGEAWQADATRGPVSSAVETVAKKVGALLHLHRIEPFDGTETIRRPAADLWGRHERVVVVIDGIEALSAAVGDDEELAAQVNSSLEGRVVQVAYELRRIADRGAAFVVTVSPRYAELVMSAATFATEMRGLESAPVPVSERALALGARPVDLVVRKNHMGSTGIVPLRFVAGAATFEERAP